MQSRPILLCSDRVGYGHIRGLLAVQDALARLGCKTKTVSASQVSSPAYRCIWHLLDYGLGALSNYCPGHYSRVRTTTAGGSFRFINAWMRRLDAGAFARYVERQGCRVVVASHVTMSYLVSGPGVQGYLLGLDPYAELYSNSAENLITTAVNNQTQRHLRALGVKRALVTGPMVPLPVYDARESLSRRLHELRSGKPLRVVLATGGCLTHGQEIADLTGAFVQHTTPQQVERISVVVGDSASMSASVARHGKGDARVSIIRDSDPWHLVRKADRAIAAADIIFAKTGELAFCVAGGKAFKAFNSYPSLGPQEIAIRDYVTATSTVGGVSALEAGLPAHEAVWQTLAQREDGRLGAMMAAGLSVPGDGALKIAQIISGDNANLAPGGACPSGLTSAPRYQVDLDRLAGT